MHLAFQTNASYILRTQQFKSSIYSSNQREKELSLCCFDLTEYEFYCSHLIQVYIKASEFDTRAFKDSTNDKCSYWTLTSAVTPFYPWAKCCC